MQPSNDELTRFNRAATDRELRMIELQREINELCRSTGAAPRDPPSPRPRPPLPHDRSVPQTIR